MSQPDTTKTFSLHLKDVSELQQAFMPFIVQGGLFITTLDDYDLGDNIGLSLQLLEESDIYPIDGTVIWITPPHAQDNRQAGIGLQFDAASAELLLPRILQYLATTNTAPIPTNTL